MTEHRPLQGATIVHCADLTPHDGRCVVQRLRSADDEMARWIARPIFPDHPHVATAASSNHCVYMWQGQRCGENVPPVIMFPEQP